jgi:hypothetical protein
MNKREIYKQWEFGGRNWRIGKFDAMTGSYIAYKLMAEILPMGLGGKIGIPVPKNGTAMSKTDFMDLQKDCLSVCSELLPAGPAPVMDENGNFGVQGLEYDAKTVLALTIQALVWNVRDFFDESLLSSMSEAMSIISPPAAKTSTSTSTPQL